MEYFIRKSQQEYFNAELTSLKKDGRLPDRTKEYKNKLEPLKPILDSRGLIRVGGRLDRAEVDYEMRHPAIIPKGSRLAWLLMERAHRVNKHGGIQVMMRHIRERYWIPQLRDELKKFTRKCVSCMRQTQPSQEQLMADLPADRVRPGRAFEASGVDYAGPFQIKYVDKEKKPLQIVKGWIAVFVCMKTRAVHLDVVPDLTSNAFIACYERFVARRGPCYRCLVTMEHPL